MSARNKKPRLTPDERESARRTGHSPERYAALREVRTLADWERLQEREAAKRRGKS